MINDPVLTKNDEDLDTPFTQLFIDDRSFDEESFFIEKALTEDEAWEATIDKPGGNHE